MPDRGAEAAQLDTSVLRRLCDTVHRHGYVLCVPLSSAEDREHPGSVVFYAAQPHLSDGRTLPTLTDTMLVVSEDGFLTWIVPFDENKALVWKCLEQHVLDLVGDISHDRDPSPGSRNIDLSDYAASGGILSYVQLDIILEGLWNRNFKLDYFFSDRRSEELNREVRGKYSIPSFIAPLLVQLTPTDELDRLAGRAVPTLRAGRADEAACVAACAALSSHLRSPAMRADRCTVLLRFLRVTKDRSLLQTKQRIEVCRRALVQELLGVAHRVQPVEQIVSPDLDSETPESVSESQLRGYLMLIAAKLPIAQNVSLYLGEVVELIDDRDGDAPETPESSELTLLEREYAAWSALLASVADNVESLERAVARSSRDRALYEQEQVRAENETLAEIERLRDSDPGGSAPSLDDSSFSALEVAIALAVSFAAAGKLFHGWNVLWLGPALMCGFIAAFILMHTAASKMLHAARIRRWIKEPMSGRVFYELDLRVDGYILNPLAEQLIEGAGIEPDWSVWLTGGAPRPGREGDRPAGARAAQLVPHRARDRRRVDHEGAHGRGGQDAARPTAMAGRAGQARQGADAPLGDLRARVPPLGPAAGLHPAGVQGPGDPPSSARHR